MFRKLSEKREKRELAAKIYTETLSSLISSNSVDYSDAAREAGYITYRAVQEFYSVEWEAIYGERKYVKR
tara:strand:+ start:253 stop:462 length:210 start_codon:yes stop_codon:yes gene_type:complete